MEFLTDFNVSGEIQKIIKKAEKKLIVISPYIKLHDRFKVSLEKRINDNELKIYIIYRKEDPKFKKENINKNDLKFLAKFPHIEIRCLKNLHAKYYANENSILLSSMNLVEYSQNNNTEFGVYFKNPSLETKILSNIVQNKTLNTFNDINKTIQNIIDYSDKLLFKKIPNYKKNLIGIKTTYNGPDLKEDILGLDKENQKISETNFKTKEKPNYYKKSYSKKVSKKELNFGYCIRCSNEIDLNIEKPFCDKCFKSWNRYKDTEYLEKFCHICGKENEVNMEKPSCYSCYKKNKSIFETLPF